MQNSCYLIPFSHELFKAFLYLYRKQIWQKKYQLLDASGRYRGDHAAIFQLLLRQMLT